MVQPTENEEPRESQIDEMWSYVGKKSQERWLWHAIGHKTGQVLAYTFGLRKDEVFLKLKALLLPFGITRFYTDALGTYKRCLTTENHVVSKYNMQKIENKHLNLRT